MDKTNDWLEQNTPFLYLEGVWKPQVKKWRKVIYKDWHSLVISKFNNICFENNIYLTPQWYERVELDVTSI